MRTGPGRTAVILAFFLVICAAATAAAAAADDKPGVLVRLKLVAPAGATWYVRLGGYIHKEPWYLPAAVVPEGADRDSTKGLLTGQFTEWFDLGAWAGKRMHGPMRRSGGVAELPNVTAEFVTDPKGDPKAGGVSVVIELATAPDDKHVVRRFEESFTGRLTSFLISPDLARDADKLETAAQMTARHLKWAREATGGKRVAPKLLMIQTSFWGPQRPELNLQEAEAVWLLGFNIVGNQTPEVKAKFGLAVPRHSHDVLFGPAATREQIDALMKKEAQRNKEPIPDGVTFGFSDEVCCRPPIGTDPNALRHFRDWLAAEKIAPAELGVEKLADVVPLETPEDYRKRAGGAAAGAAAARVFYYTSRFRQAAATQAIRWHTEAFHKYFPGKALTSTLVADHPYFGGTGLGMGMVPNTTWGGAPLAMDWFDLARRKAVDLAGIEDWMGLQYMYGPSSTWEGFQLMGFQAAMFRSGGRGQVPIIAWITPSDETNLRLKSASALCQGAKHFFYWTYGPTATSTENYWSDLRSEYDGVAAMARQLAAAEHVIAPGEFRKTRLALLYSISSDLWQPFGYVHMLERRATYLSLVHEQFLVDMLTEQDIEAGRLGEYDVLYATDPCITVKAAAAVSKWVRNGGRLYGSCAAGSRNEFNEPAAGLAEAFGIGRDVRTTTQEGRYRYRCGLNDMTYTDRVRVDPAYGAATEFGVLGTKAAVAPAGAKVVGTFGDGSPAVLTHEFGKGRCVYVAACPGLSYIKDAKFVAAELKESWPPAQRAFINAAARARDVGRLVELSHPVVEAGIFQTPSAVALVLANFTYKPIDALQVRLAAPAGMGVKSVRSVERGPLKFAVDKDAGGAVVFTMPLGTSDIVLVE